MSEVKHKYSVGDRVVYVNDFGVVWGIKTIIELDERTNKPTYYYEGSETPWYSVNEENFVAPEPEDFNLDAAGLQEKYGFKPTDYFGCY